MFETLLIFLVLGLLVFGIFVCSKMKNHVFAEAISFLLIVCVGIAIVVAGAHSAGVITANCTVNQNLSKKVAEYEDLKYQVETYTDQAALVTVMERVEEYNKEVAYGKMAAHSAWNAWSYPARLYDNLELIYVGGLPNEG